MLHKLEEQYPQGMLDVLFWKVIFANKDITDFFSLNCVLVFCCFVPHAKQCVGCLMKLIEGHTSHSNKET